MGVGKKNNKAIFFVVSVCVCVCVCFKRNDDEKANGMETEAKVKEMKSGGKKMKIKEKQMKNNTQGVEWRCRSNYGRRCCSLSLSLSLSPKQIRESGPRRHHRPVVHVYFSLSLSLSLSLFLSLFLVSVDVYSFSSLSGRLIYESDRHLGHRIRSGIDWVSIFFCFVFFFSHRPWVRFWMVERDSIGLKPILHFLRSERLPRLFLFGGKTRFW